MTQPPSMAIYGLGATSLNSTDLFPVFQPRDPTNLDINYSIGKIWVNNVGTPNAVFMLTSFTSVSGQVLATWVQLSSGTFGGDVTQLTGNVGVALPAAGNINVVGGGGITTTGAGSTLTISAAGGGFTWSTVAVNTAMAVNNGYVTNGAVPLQMLLPPVAAVGDSVQIMGLGVGGWQVIQNGGQTIRFNSVSTTTGGLGSLSSTQRYNGVELICIVTNTDWIVADGSGNFVVV